MDKPLPLVYQDFADERITVAEKNVSEVIENGDRVWVTVKDGFAFQMIEVKNIETVIGWGRSSGKLSDWGD